MRGLLLDPPTLPRWSSGEGFRGPGGTWSAGQASRAEPLLWRLAGRGLAAEGTGAFGPARKEVGLQGAMAFRSLPSWGLCAAARVLGPASGGSGGRKAGIPRAEGPAGGRA